MKGKKIKVDLHVKGIDLAGRDHGSSDPYYIIYVPDKSKSEESGNLPETITHSKSHCLFPFVLPASAALYGINHANVTTTSPKGFKVVYKSEKIKKNLNPEWKPGKQNLKDICYGDLTTPVVFQCWHSNLIHDSLIGGSIITMEDLFSVEVAELQLMDNEHKPAGILQIKAIPDNLVVKEGDKTPLEKSLEAKTPEHNFHDKSPRRGSFPYHHASPKSATSPTIRLGSRDRKSVAYVPALEEQPIQYLPGSSPMESSPVSEMIKDSVTIQYLPGSTSDLSSDSKPTEKESESTSGATEAISVTQTEPEYTYLPPADLL